MHGIRFAWRNCCHRACDRRRTSRRARPGWSVCAVPCRRRRSNGQAAGPRDFAQQLAASVQILCIGRRALRKRTFPTGEHTIGAELYQASAALAAECCGSVRRHRVGGNRSNGVLRQIDLLDDADRIDDDIGTRRLDRGLEVCVLQNVYIRLNSVGASQGQSGCGRVGNRRRTDRSGNLKALRRQPPDKLVPKHAGCSEHQHVRDAASRVWIRRQFRLHSSFPLTIDVAEHLSGWHLTHQSIKKFRISRGPAQTEVA